MTRQIAPEHQAASVLADEPVASEAPRPTLTPSEVLELADEFSLTFSLVYGRLRRLLIRRGLLTVNVTLERVRVLGHLREGGATRIGTLAFYEQVSQPTMTEILGGMESLGWIQRKRDESDRRAVLISITRAGRIISDEFRAARARAVIEILESLSPSEVLALRECVPALNAMNEFLLNS